METQLNETKTAIEKAATKEEVTAIEKKHFRNGRQI